MPLLHLYDRATIEGSLDLPLDPELHDLLAARVAHLTAQGLVDMTEIIVVDGNTVEPEIVAALGFTPLVDGEGRRFGQPGYLCTAADYVARVSPSYHEAIICIGNSGFAFQVLVHDGADPDLVALCQELAS